MKKANVTALRCSLAAMLLWGMSAQAREIVITTTKSEYVPGGVRYYFEVNGWADEWRESPCSTSDPKLSFCEIDLSAMLLTSFNITLGSYGGWSVPTRQNSTMGALLTDLGSKGFRIPLRGSIFVSSKYAPSDICIALLAAKIGSSIGGISSKFSPCYPVAKPALQCDITGYGLIDHKTLEDNAFEGATASTQLGVQCHGPSSVTVSTSRTDAYGVQLRDDGSLYSRITVNGKDATKGINVPIAGDQSTPLTITSTLVKRGSVTPGQFSGSTVVTVSPP